MAAMYSFENTDLIMSHFPKVLKTVNDIPCSTIASFLTSSMGQILYSTP